MKIPDERPHLEEVREFYADISYEYDGRREAYFVNLYQLFARCLREIFQEGRFGGPFDTVLDAGCGYGRWCHLIRSNYWEAGLAEPPSVDGFDAFEANVQLCRQSGCYRNVWRHELPSPLQGQWDTVLACELIEHLPQSAVPETLELLERAARRRIVVTTPNVSDLRDGLEQIGGFNEYEAHKSYVPRSFFREHGYTLRGAGTRARSLSRLQLESLSHRLPVLGVRGDL